MILEIVDLFIEPIDEEKIKKLKNILKTDRQTLIEKDAKLIELEKALRRIGNSKIRPNKMGKVDYTEITSLQRIAKTALKKIMKA